MRSTAVKRRVVGAECARELPINQSARAKGEERRAIKATIFHLPWLHHRVHTSTGEDPSRNRQWAGLLTPGSTYKPRLPTGFSARSGRCGVRPRLQRRDRNGFAPFSLFFGSGSRFQIGTHVASNRTRTNSVVKPLEVFQVDPRPWPYPPRRPVRVADMSLARYDKILGSTVRLERRKPIAAETGSLLDQGPEGCCQREENRPASALVSVHSAKAQQRTRSGELLDKPLRKIKEVELRRKEN